MPNKTIPALPAAAGVTDDDLFVMEDNPGGVSQTQKLTGAQLKTYISAAVGTVTSVSVVTANGVSGSVANPTTTPAITLTLGAITPSSITLGATVKMSASGDGILLLTNAAANDFARIQLGGTTSSFPAIKRSATAAAFRLADDSADAPITTAAITASDQITITRGTITTLTPSINITETWNNAAIAFKTIQANVTNTASSVNSALVLMQIGGADRFRVAYTGQVTLSRVEADTTGSTLTLGKQGTTGNAAAAIASGSEISRFETTGYDTTAQVTSFRLINTALETFSATARGSRLDFQLVPVTTTPLLTIMQLDTTALSLVGGARLVITRGTITTNAPSIDITTTWNAGGVTFQAILLNVTDTASATASKLIDLQVASATVFNVLKSGAVTTMTNGAAATPAFVFGGRGANWGFWSNNSSTIAVTIAGTTYYTLDSNQRFQINGQNAKVSWGTSPDAEITRETTGTLGMQSSTTAQSFRIYNTFTSSTNFERLDIQWATNVCQIWTEKGSGGGTARVLVLGADATELMRFDTGSKISFFGATTVVKQTSGANLTNNVTAGGTTDQIDDFTNLTVYSTDAATIRNDIYQLARKLAQINNGLRSYGIFT